MSNIYTIVCSNCQRIFEDDINTICECGHDTTVADIVFPDEVEGTTDTHIRCPNCDMWHRKQVSYPWDYWCQCGAKFGFTFSEINEVALKSLYIACDLCGGEFDVLVVDCCDCEGFVAF